MRREDKLKPITDGETKVYARQGGWHYHLDRECPMLKGGDFEKLGYKEIREKLGYKEISVSDIAKRKLNPCLCAYADFGVHKHKEIVSPEGLGGKG